MAIFCRAGRSSPAAWLLLALICQQAAAQAGQIQSTDEQLANTLALYPPSIPGLLKQLQVSDCLAIDDDSTPRILRPSAELLADYLPTARSLPARPAPSARPAPTSADPAVRVCPVTGLDVSHQRENVPLASRTTLCKLASAHYPTFKMLYGRFLPLVDAESSINEQSAHLASHIRQRWAAQRSGLL